MWLAQLRFLRRVMDPSRWETRACYDPSWSSSFREVFGRSPAKSSLNGQVQCFAPKSLVHTMAVPPDAVPPRTGLLDCLRAHACCPLFGFLRVGGMAALLGTAKGVAGAVTSLQRTFAVAYAPGKLSADLRSQLWAEALRPPLGTVSMTLCFFPSTVEWRRCPLRVAARGGRVCVAAKCCLR